MSTSTLEIRERAVAACENHATVAQCYGVHLRTIQRWLERFRETGGVEALPKGHPVPTFDEAEMQHLAALVEKKNDATLAELSEKMRKTCSLTTVHNALKRLKYTVKKNTAGKRTRSS
ncbi:TPA: hypothetical protein DDW35_03395 [Candidatus Sumerlaeota bacterium]|nr:hypothetical protein [Candidatus Sumerlaeota bacterium]